MAACLDALGKTRVRFAAHSFGGGVALTLAARMPGRVERLLLEDAVVYPLPLELKGRVALMPGIGRFLFTKVYSRRDLAAHFRSAFREPPADLDAYVDYYWERFNRANAREVNYAILRTIGALADNTGDPSRVQAPTLLVWGEEDRIVPLAHGKRLVKQVPGARLEVVGACGHSPHEERPDEWLRHALPFLRGEALAEVAADAR